MRSVQAKGLRLLAALAFVFAAGCDAEETTNPGASDVNSGDATVTDDATPGPADVAEGPQGDPVPEGELIVVEPGGDTICSRGTPFRFYAYGGDPQKVIVDFQGGGACWSPITCSVQDAIFSPEAPSESDVRAYWDSPFRTGLYELENPDNPLAGWTLLHIPYCTGDIHWGNAEHTYSDDLVVHHKGYVNATAALEWLYEHYPNPDMIFVTGCSAGAYGAIGHAAHIAENLPSAQMRVVADAGAGVITDSFFNDSFPNWQVDDAMPTWLDGLAGLDIMDLVIEDLYTAVGDGYPEMRLAQHNAAYDDDQTFYYQAMGGDPVEWAPKLVDKLAAIEAATDNFTYYTSPGPIHCLHPYNFFYERESGGVAYTDWLNQLVHGDTNAEVAKCDGDACLDDALCDACLDGTSTDFGCGWCNGWGSE